MKNRHRTIVAALLCPIFIVLLFGSAKTAFSEKLCLQSYNLESPKLQEELRLVMLSDLHGSIYGKEQKILLSKIKNCAPHAVLLVGDLFDNQHDCSAAEALLRGISSSYPCYYVSGNHEYTAEFEKIKSLLEGYGVVCLWGEGRTIELPTQQIFLAGIADRNHTLYYSAPSLPLPQGQLSALEEERKKKEHLYSVLLCHRPETPLFEGSGFDLILSGHNHGGQLRIPGILNGLFTPTEGFFPKYAGGCYRLSGPCMIVGRGLAKNSIPRLFNRPEVVLITVSPENTHQ